MLALLDRDEQHHGSLREIFIANRASWVVPSAVLPELDYLASGHLGADAQAAVLADLARGEYEIAWADGADLARAVDLTRQYRALRFGLVDGMVMACAERLKAEAIATLDLRHFGPVRLRSRPRLLPRDL